MQQYLCMVGVHKYISLDTTDCFHTHTQYTDRNWVIRHIVWYQQCSCCGKRRLKDNYKNESTHTGWKHGGLENARVQWETNGMMYLGNGFTKVGIPPKPTKKN